MGEWAEVQLHPDDVVRAYRMFVAVVFVFGLIVGSFLNVVIYRLPAGESVVKPRSRCPGCALQIAWYDNIPVLSWLLLRGRCRNCHASISLRYPAVELLTGAIFAAVAARFGFSLDTLVFVFFGAALVVVAMIDVDHQIIPDEISLGGLALGLVGMPLLLVSHGYTTSGALLFSWGGALLGGGVLWFVGFAHARVSVAMGREFEHWPGEGESIPVFPSVDYWTWFPGLGFGDVKLLAMIGAFVGPYGVMLTIVAASFAGIVLGVGWMIATRRYDSPFGFAPAIAVGTLVVLLVPLDAIGL